MLLSLTPPVMFLDIQPMELFIISSLVLVVLIALVLAARNVLMSLSVNGLI